MLLLPFLNQQLYFLIIFLLSPAAPKHHPRKLYLLVKGVEGLAFYCSRRISLFDIGGKGLHTD